MYQITNADTNDLDTIYQLFDEAIAFQQRNNFVGWNGYDKEFIQSDIANKLLFKIIEKHQIICIFSICFSDTLIWRERETGNAIYLHRVIVDQSYRNKKTFQWVLDWTIDLAKKLNLTFIRIDTWSANLKLISYYQTFGFLPVGYCNTTDSEDLPAQHRNQHLTLLERCISSVHENGKLLKKVVLLDQFSKIDRFWDQKVIGHANGQLIKLAKGIGAINWHKHDDQDELFILYSGQLTIQLRDQDIELRPQELFIVPRGTEHRPIAAGEAKFLIMGMNVTSNEAGGRPKEFDQIQN